MKRQILASVLLCILIFYSMAGCASKKENVSGINTSSLSGSFIDSDTDISLKNIRNAVKQAYGTNYIPNIEYTKYEISEKFGLKDDLYEDVLAEGPLLGANADTFIAVKAQKGKADKVEAALKKYRKTLINDTTQFPANKAKIQASQVMEKGRYVFFLLLGNIAIDVNGDDEKAMQKAAREQNKIAEDTINKLFEK